MLDLIIPGFVWGILTFILLYSVGIVKMFESIDFILYLLSDMYICDLQVPSILNGLVIH